MIGEGLDSHSVQKGANVTLPCGAEYSYDVNIPDKPDDADVTCANKGVCTSPSALSQSKLPG